MAAAASQPFVTVQSLENDMATDGSSVVNFLPLFDVMKASIRVDFVTSVHGQIWKNSRQPYAVSKRAGRKTSAESWGLDVQYHVFLMSLVVRAGQGAFGNM
ncbi:60S ribosomal protein L4-1 [Abeliophyllum distichum]|uniref:60S ribosomal protein L4-1 n=1 Tax=Abeliophyllum distichum TaxID=126358 RepID=A0ABD1RA14_9LAMI